ncbi:MAG: DNA primase [candidate division Zixibacteria bacterium]|nr:DNA primase [candidate division Zixibacteria bacterium]
MIDQETIEQVRQATDIVQIVNQYAPLKKRGRYHWACCPFHEEKTPSFKVSQDNQLFYCFGCGKGGNVFSFLMEHEAMSFADAVRFLATRANISIKEDAGGDYKRELMERLNYAHAVAVEYYHDVLLGPRYKSVLENYVKKRRGLETKTINQFKLGLAGEGWDEFVRFAETKDLKPEELVKAGLAGISEKTGNAYDRFRQRLMIPIFNLSQKPIAFGGRTLTKGEPAKYVNSPETPLYHKSNVLYGLNFTRDFIRKANSVIVVEGYFDVLSLWQVDVRNVVASSGTAFTSQQAHLLARFADEVYLFFDADSAGQQAALRSIDALFDAGLEVKVMQAPEGEDPDSIAQKFGRDKIEELQYDALPYIQYRVRNIDLKKSGIIAREKLIKELAELSQKVDDVTRRSLFVQEAAQVLGVDQSLFTNAAEAGRTSAVARPPAPPVSNKLETDFLSLLFHNPGSIDEILEAVAPDDFDSKQLSRLYSAMITQYKMDGALSASRLVEHFQDEELISVLGRVASTDWEPDTITSEARARTKRFRERKLKRIHTQLKKELLQAESDGDQDKADRILQELKRHGL